MVKLTYTLKRKWEPIVINQTGKVCFHCNCENMELNPLEWGHLNGNDNDSRPENLAFMCKTCNNKQKFNYDMQILANEQLQKNEKAVLTRERMLADTGTTKELTSQQEISKINKRITKQFIQEQTINNQELILRDIVNAIVDICDDNNGTGSQSAVYRYIDSLTNPYTGKYTLSTNSEGKTVIRRRTEN